MISICIFSKDRPMQLDLCLRSIKQNAPYFTDVKVLYLAEGKFKDGYKLVREEHPEVTFIPESTDFCQQIWDIVHSNQEYFAWGTDDSIICKKVELGEHKLNAIFKDMGCVSIVMRVGENMKNQDHFQHNPSTPGPIVARFEDMIVWDVLQCNKNYDIGRPWQNDCSIMPRDMYIERLKQETYWREHKSKSLDYTGDSGRCFNPCLAAAFQDIIYLNIPVNLVHLREDGKALADFGNWGRQVRYDTATLNELFLAGKRIDLDALNLENVDCPRREMEYRFYRK